MSGGTNGMRPDQSYREMEARLEAAEKRLRVMDTMLGELLKRVIDLEQRLSDDNG